MARDRILQEVVNYFKSQYYTFSDDWLNGCVEYFCSENPNPTAIALQTFVVDQWKLADLRDMGTVCLPPNLVNARKIMLQGKYAMQVETMLDVSISCYAQYQTLLKLTLNEGDEQPTGQVKEAKANRMWEMTLCDGTQMVKALEHEPIRSLDQPLIPGTKVLIVGPVLSRKGKLMLTERNIKVLGGEIDSMIIDNAYENILRRKLGLDLNPDPYNENLAVPAAIVALLPNVGQGRAPCNNNVPPLLPPPPSNPWEDESTYTDADVREDHEALFFEDDDNDLIDAAVDAQLLAIEQQHTSTGREDLEEFEQQYQDISDVVNLSDNEDLQSFNIEEIEREAMEQSRIRSTLNESTLLSKQTLPTKNTSYQSFQNPSVNRLSSVGQSTNKANQNPSLDRESSRSHQAAHIQSKARQSSNQAYPNPSMNVPQSSNQTFPNPTTVRKSGNQVLAPTQSKIRRPSPSSQTKSSKQSSPVTTQTKLTSFLKLSKPGEQTSSSSSPGSLKSFDRASSHEPVTPKQTLLNTSNAHELSSSNKSLSDWTTPKGKPTTSWDRYEPGTSAQSSSRTASVGPFNDRPLPTMTCGPEDSEDTPLPSKPPVCSHSDKEPFVYLRQIVTSPPASRTVVTVKAIVITTVTTASIKKDGWHLIAKISDGSAVVEALFSSDVVESLIGFSPQEVKAMKSEISRNPNIKEKLKKAFDKAKSTLINLNCLMEVEFPGDGTMPCVISLTDLTEAHFTALRRRLDNLTQS